MIRCSDNFKLGFGTQGPNSLAAGAALALLGPRPPGCEEALSRLKDVGILVSPVSQYAELVASGGRGSNKIKAGCTGGRCSQRGMRSGFRGPLLFTSS